MTTPVPPVATPRPLSVVDHQVHPAFPAPYTIVLVDLDDHPGVRFVGHLPGAADLSAGEPVRVRFEELADGTVLPQWEPVSGGTT